MPAIPNEGGAHAIDLLRILNTHNPSIGHFVGSVIDFSFGMSIKSSNGRVPIPQGFFEEYKKSGHAISPERYEEMANRFIPD